MGSNLTKSYAEQEKALKNKIISFELNLYFIGEDIYPLYQNFNSRKLQDTGEIYTFWNYYYCKGDYEKQLDEMKKKFKEKQDNFKKNPANIFKEVILVKMNKADDNKIKNIFDTFADDQDVYCPFIIFILNKENLPEGKNLDVIPDQEEYYISPLKVITLRFQKYDVEETMKLYKRLWRICSYYNELGDQFIIWPKYEESPYPYDLINSDSPSYLNIFCLGKTGSGKSTFLNKFFKEQRSKQGGTGKSTTTKIIRYGIENFPIRIYDIPGFEGKDTIKIVNKKLSETIQEMYNDKDRVHLILYFINFKEETIFYEMEDTIIKTLRENNSDVRIIFVLTHCSINPYDEKLNKKKKDILKNKIDKCINIISSIFGNTYSIEQNYFKKNSLIQENLILVNLIKDYENDKEEFGFENIIEAIYKTITKGNSLEILQSIENILFDAIKNKTKINSEIDKNIESKLKQSYLLNQTTFALQKEKAIAEATKLYNNMFTIGNTALLLCPYVRDAKLGILKYQKYMFKKNLKKIFGFSIKNDSFEDEEKMNNYTNINQNYYEKKEIEKENKEKENLVNEIRKNYHKTEVNSTWIFTNEVMGIISYACLFGGPIGLTLGGAGLIGTSYVSYQQFKKDCTEYFEQYKKCYEENKYYSLLNFIISIQKGIEFFRKYLEDLKNDNNQEIDLQANPNVEGINENIKAKLNSMDGGNKEIYEQIPVLN